MNTIFALQSDHPLFRYLTPEERRYVESLGKIIRIAEGDFLIRSDDADATLFAVEDGHLDVEAFRDGAALTIATVGPGEVLGEISFIDDSPRSVSVRAGEEAVLLAWDKPSLLAALADKPELVAKISVALNELLVERLRESVRRHGASRSL